MEKAIAALCPRGTVLLVTSRASLTDCLNPSAEKHAAIYVGEAAPLRAPPGAGACGPCAIDASAPHGARVTPLADLLRHCAVVKAYCLAVPFAGALMSMAADTAFSLVGTPYGFNAGRTYCFKLVADCFASVGIRVRSRRIMGREVILSQDLVASGAWVKVLDSSDGACLEKLGLRPQRRAR
nr:MAG: hypothetical protein [Equine parapoxvirus]